MTIQLTTFLQILLGIMVFFGGGIFATNFYFIKMTIDNKTKNIETRTMVNAIIKNCDKQMNNK